MELSSSSGKSIRYIETYATAANHPMPSILKVCCVVLLCGLFGVRRFATSGTYPWSFVRQIFHTGQPSHGGDRKTFEAMISA